MALLYGSTTSAMLTVELLHHSFTNSPVGTLGSPKTQGLPTAAASKPSSVLVATWNCAPLLAVTLAHSVALPVEISAL